MVEQGQIQTKGRRQTQNAETWLRRVQRRVASVRRSKGNDVQRNAKPQQLDTPAAMRMQQGLLVWLRSAQAAVAWAGLLVILGVAAGIYLHQISQTAIVGRVLIETQVALDNQRDENSRLRRTIAVEQSLDSLQARITAANLQLGKTELTRIEYLPVTVPAAPAPPAPALPPTPPPIETIGAALRQFVRQNITILALGAFDGG